jgi:hypothetical protein
LAATKKVTQRADKATEEVETEENHHDKAEKI